MLITLLPCSCCNWPRKYKTVSRRERLERLQAEWARQLDTLTDTYLRWKHGVERVDPMTEDIGANGWEASAMSMSCEFPSVSTTRTLSCSFSAFPSTDYCSDQTFPTIDEDPFVNVTLIKRGFLGSAPIYPTTVFSLKTLEDYRLERLQCGRWSFLHKAKVLCHKHNVSPLSTLTGACQLTQSRYHIVRTLGISFRMRSTSIIRFSTTLSIVYRLLLVGIQRNGLRKTPVPAAHMR